jgi:pimeloyl-ACP methyl ester carboxylesterase
MRVAVGLPEAAITHMSQPSPAWSQTQAMAHTLLYDGAVMGDGMRGQPLSAEKWAAVTTPTLVMAGGASADWARNTAQALAAVLPHAQYQVLPGQTHSAAPEVLAPVLEAFFTA